MTIAEQEIEVQEVNAEQAVNANDYVNGMLNACSDFGSFALTLGIAFMCVYIITIVQGEKEDPLHAALFSFGLFGLSVGTICKTIPAIYNNNNNNEDEAPEVVPMV